MEKIKPKKVLEFSQIHKIKRWKQQIIPSHKTIKYNNFLRQSQIFP